MMALLRSALKRVPLLTAVLLASAPAPSETPTPASPPTAAAPRTYALSAVWPPEQTGLIAPRGISFGLDGQIYVVDAANYHAVALDAGGNPVHTWLFEPAPTSSFSSPPPAVVGLPDGDIAVLHPPDGIVDNEHTYLVARYNRSGNTVWGWPSERDRAPLTRKPGDIAHPGRGLLAALAVDRAGRRVLVLDAGGPSVGALNADHGLVESEPEYLPPAGTERLGWTTYEFDWYVDLDLMTDGRLAVLNQARRQLALRRARWSPNQRLASTEIQLDGKPRRIAADGANNVFVLDADGFVQRFSSDGQLLATLDARGPSPSVLTFLSDLAVTDGGAVLVTDQQSGNIYVYEAVDRPAPRVDFSQAHCRITAEKSAAPSRLPLGADVEVSLAVGGRCPERVGSDIVLAVDVGRPEWVDLHRFNLAVARRLVQAADLTRDRIGIVGASISSVPNDYLAGPGMWLEVPLTDDRSTLMAAVDRLEQAVYELHRPTWFTGDGLRPAERELFSARARPGARRILVRLNAFGNAAHDLIGLPGSPIVEGRGVQILALMASPRRLWDRSFCYNDCDTVRLWMRYMASGWWDYYEPGTFGPDDAPEIHASISDPAAPYKPTVLASAMTITDVVPSNMTYDLGSAVPAAQWEAAGRVVTWRLTNVPLGGTQLRYRLRPQEAGEWPTNVAAWADYTDGLGQPGGVGFPVPTVEVIAPTPTVSPTATGMPTATAPSATPSPTPRPAELPRPVYLPLVLKEPPCEASRQHADVVLVMDASRSMEGAKLEAAQDAARQFLRVVDLPEDRVGVVAFNQDAFVQSGLTGSIDELETAIAAIVTGPGTRIDRGVSRALEVLDTAPAPGDRPQVIVLMTDGRQYEAPESAQRTALDARHKGITLYVIGLGQDVDASFLSGLAGTAANYFYAPHEDELASIYRAIAKRMPCPTRRYWGRR